MANHVLKNKRKKVKEIHFACNLDALSRNKLFFTKLNTRNQSKIFGKEATGRVLGNGFATMEDVMHVIGCDLFGKIRYNITITAEEIPDVKKQERKKKAREKKVKAKLLTTRTLKREERKLKKEIERIQWDNREKITPIRNPKDKQ